MGKKKETMPWEDYAQEAKAAPKEVVKEEEEESSPWDDYTSNFAQQRDLDSGMAKTVKETGKDMAILGAEGATLNFMDEIGGIVGQLGGKDYTETRDSIRETVDGARERSPILGPVAEGIGSAVTTSAIPGLRGGKVLAELGTAAISGAGSAREMSDVPESVGTNMAIDAVTQGVGKVAKHVIAPPSGILANAMGARGIQYRNGEVITDSITEDTIADRLKNPAGLAKRLDDIGFFGFGQKHLDPTTGKFHRYGGIEDHMTPVTLESMLGRVQQGVGRLADRNKVLIAGKKIPLDKVNQTLQSALNKFVPTGSDMASRSYSGNQLIQEIVGDLQARGHVKLDSKGRAYVDADNIEQIKRFMQDKVAQTFSSGKAVGDITNEGVQARRMFSKELDDLVDLYGGAEYAKNNDLMRDLMTARTMLHDKSSRLAGYSGGGPRLTNLKHLLSSGLENTVYHPQADIMRARAGQMMSTPAGKILGTGLERTPYQMMNDRTPQSVPNNGRAPQSVPNIPEQFIRTPLPRTTTELLQNKNFVLGKVAQMAPEMFEGIKDVFENDPDRLSELAPMLAQNFPHLFARDKYNRFDGRIYSEKDKARAIKDTLSDARLNSIQQSAIITKLNKEGLYDG